ncbi:YigZ family protein [Pseudomonas sp. F1_0610]|uniref:IMPACT family protein n=1 Tax=Pseudomonas sp. F1_0610 TaxID=3114284 RepID=UPI0039C04806
MNQFTLTACASFEEDIKKSRFLTLAAPIQTPQDAMQFLAQHSVAEATHNCWAWKCGEQQYRFNDDGEPSGTAGRPILAAIEGQSCDYLVVLVIRWYGGIKLGTGGLARAYGGGATKCLQQAQLTPIVQRIAAYCDLTFADIERCKNRLVQAGCIIEHETYNAQGVHLTLSLETHVLDELNQLLADLTRGRSQITRL